MSTVRLFGSIAALVNGNMFGGLFQRAAIVKVGPADYADAMKLDGSEPFDPMGTGRVMSNTVLLPETVMDEPGELRDWFRKAFEYTATLPPKKKKKPAKAKPTTRKPAAARSTTAAKKRVAKAPAKARRAARK